MSADRGSTPAAETGTRRGRDAPAGPPPVDVGPAFLVDELVEDAGDRKNGTAGLRPDPAAEQSARRPRRPRISAQAVSGDAEPAHGRGAA